MRTAYKERQRDEVTAKARAARSASCLQCGRRKFCGTSAQLGTRLATVVAKSGIGCRTVQRAKMVLAAWVPGQTALRWRGANFVGQVDSVVGIFAVSSLITLPVGAMDAQGFCRLRYVTAQFFAPGGRPLGELAVLPDTGASTLLMGRADLEAVRGNRANLVPLNRPLLAANGLHIETDGTAVFEV